MKETVKFTFTATEVETEADAVYKKQAGHYKIQGFRGGKAPRKMIEQQYGPVFIEPALSSLFNRAFKEHLAKNPTLRAVCEPDVEAKPKGDGFEITATIDIQPPFTLGKYKGIEIKGEQIKITDTEVNGFLQKIAKERSRQVAAESGHKIVNGDIAVIDFVGSVDGVEFPGGSAKNHSLEIGSKSFIDTFEEQLVGKIVGDKIDVRVTFPKEYHAKELAGKKALFRVEIRNILVNQVPAIDDNLAKESSEFDTLDKFKKDIRARLEKQAVAESDKRNMDKLIQTICDNTKINVNPKLVESQFEQDLYELEQNLSKSGIGIEDYVQYIGMDIDAFKKHQREQSAARAHFLLVMDEIVKTEKLKSDFETIEKFLKKENNIKC